MDLKTLDPCL